MTYVSNIYKYYVAYRLLTEQDQERRKAKESVKQGELRPVRFRDGSA